MNELLIQIDPSGLENTIGDAIEVGKGISEFGFLAMIGGFYLVITAILIMGMMGFVRKVVQKMFDKFFNERESKDAIMVKTLREVSESIKPLADSAANSSLASVTSLSNIAFQGTIDTVINLILKVKEENNINNEQAIHIKVRRLLTNVSNDRKIAFNSFKYNGKRLSQYLDDNWIELVEGVFLQELYNEPLDNLGRVRTNISSMYEEINNEFIKNLINDTSSAPFDTKKFIKNLNE